MNQTAATDRLAVDDPDERVAMFTRNDRLLLSVLLGATFMAAMDVAIVNVAAPRLGAGLHVSGAGLQLIISAYTIAYAALLITGSRLGHTRGYRTMFLVGLSGFTIASLVCGAAPTAAVLVFARAVQGAAAAAMTPQVMTILQLTFSGRTRARALAAWATVISCGAVAGQVVGGALVSADVAGLSWRPVFLVNVPIGVGLFLLGRRVLPITGGANTQTMDVIGVVMLSGTVLALVIPLSFGRQAHWAWWTWALLADVVPMTFASWRHLRRLSRAGGAPLIDPMLLRLRPLTLGLGAVSALMAAYGACLFALTLHLQGALGDSPMRSGLIFAPYAVGFGVASLLVPRLHAAWTGSIVVGGLMVCAVSYGALGLVLRLPWDAAMTLPLLACAGAGFGAGYSPVIARAIARIPSAQAQAASGLLNTIVQLSFAIGVATLGSLYLAGATDPHASANALATTLAACSLLAVVAAALARAANRADQ